MLGLFSLLGIGVGLTNDARIHNQKYFGTPRDNPEVKENRRACQELYRKYSKEWQ